MTVLLEYFEYKYVLLKYFNRAMYHEPIVVHNRDRAEKI